MLKKAGGPKPNAGQGVYLVERHNLVGPFPDSNGARRFLRLMTYFCETELDVEIVEIKEDPNQEAIQAEVNHSGRIR